MATTKTTLRKNSIFKLTSPEGLGTGLGSVPPGTEVTVELVHTKPLAGVGGDEGVLFSWPTIDSPDVRSAHLPTADFLRAFKKVGK